VPEDLAGLTEEELEHRIAGIRAQMKPLDEQLVGLRAQRDVLLTEKRRRERGAHREVRAELKSAMGSLDDFVFNLKTGGEVRLGFPGARAQSLAFTDGAQAAQAKDLAEAARLYEAGWELGSPGRPGVRVHFPGTRQERLVPAEEVFARPRGPD